MTAVITAFGAIVGYLGAEVAEETAFERLLWPQRFHNYLDAVSVAKLAFLMPMSGPLHRAALATLDGFRDHGLYKGFLRGDMLGTAFLAEKQGITYFHRTAPPSERDTPHTVYNGFWLEVLKDVERLRDSVVRASPEADDERGITGPPQRMRATKPLFRLRLEAIDKRTMQKIPHTAVSESHCTGRTFLGILASEFSTICVAIATGLWYRLGDSADGLPDPWLIGFFCIPLFLKLVAALLTVRREGVYGRGARTVQISQGEPSPKADASSTTDGSSTADQRRPLNEPAASSLSSNGGDGKTREGAAPPMGLTVDNPIPNREEIIEVIDPNSGFVLINSSWPLSSSIYHFFRHYGHPIRSSFMDRVRETAGIAIVYTFVLYFPAGLFALSWMSQSSQYLWLGQQLYCVIAMHIARMCGWQGCARTEERIARLLCRNETVCLVGDRDCIKATLAMQDLDSVRQGRARVLEILREANDATPVS